MGLFNFLGGAFGMGKKSNPATSAQKYLNQIPGTITPYYQPYINAGQQAMPQLQEQYQMLLNNPQMLMQKFGNSFQQSPGYQWNYNQNMNAIENAAAAGGMTGTPQHQQQAGTMASGLANQEYYNYLNQIMGMYGQGLQGTENINTQGYGASNELAQSLANNLMSQGNLAYAGKANQNQASGNFLGTLVKGGLGYAVGGPMGALAGVTAGGGR